jgi:hypothetical protein
MRKMMMAALFSVLSLSACVDMEPGQPAEASNESVDEAPAEQPPCHAAPPTISDDMAEQVSELPPVLTAIPCDDNGDCWSNVCDREKHYCREFPF